jgi:hypothetical protein
MLNDTLRSKEQGVAAFVAATNGPDDGAYGYQMMLERLFKTFESDHGPAAAIDTVLEALKPVLRLHHDLSKVRAKFADIVENAEASN